MKSWSFNRLLVKRKKAVKATSIEEQDNTIEEVKVEEVELDEIVVPTTTTVEIHQNNQEVLLDEQQETVQETKL
ncbi:hypothetical protein [Spiroplasma endosymbiont of Tipula paludosa]|uniref:hypothetical protein n=1 Tax=Spiroplasma endosymbiont of Tipula paludosa TaxID=3066295 RepID=UPI0035C88F33